MTWTGYSNDKDDPVRWDIRGTVVAVNGRSFRIAVCSRNGSVTFPMSVVSEWETNTGQKKNQELAVGDETTSVRLPLWLKRAKRSEFEGLERRNG